MNTGSLSDSTSPTRLLSGKCLLGLLLLALMAGLAATSAESFWIDEGGTAYFAKIPSFAGLAEALRETHLTESQTPFHSVYLWGWEKAFGSGEFVLRVANLPWVLLGYAALLWAMRRAEVSRSVAIFFILAASFSPFVWFYLNQARAYALLFAGGCLFLAYLLEVALKPQRAFQWPTLPVGVCGALLLCGASLLGVPWFGAALLALIWIFWKTGRAGERFPRPPAWAVALLVGLAVGLALLAAYYVQTLLHGTRGGEQRTPFLLLVGFGAYETFGLAGLGPARNALREAGVKLLVSYLPQLTLGAAAVFGIPLAGAFALLRRGPGSIVARRALCFALLPLVLLYGMAAGVRFQVLGRHLIAGFPCFLLILACALSALFENRRTRWLPLVFLAAWACSAGMLRFAPRHQRDDYRNAAAVARQALAEGRRVWWAADQRTGEYYGLSFDRQPGLVLWVNPEAEALAAEPQPDVAVLSKPDVYDNSGAMKGYLSSHGFAPKAVFTAFTVFEKRR